MRCNLRCIGGHARAMKGVRPHMTGADRGLLVLLGWWHALHTRREHAPARHVHSWAGGQRCSLAAVKRKHVCAFTYRSELGDLPRWMPPRLSLVIHLWDKDDARHIKRDLVGNRLPPPSTRTWRSRRQHRERGSWTRGVGRRRRRGIDEVRSACQGSRCGSKDDDARMELERCRIQAMSGWGVEEPDLAVAGSPDVYLSEILDA